MQPEKNAKQRARQKLYFFRRALRALYCQGKGGASQRPGSGITRSSPGSATVLYVSFSNTVALPLAKR